VTDSPFFHMTHTGEGKILTPPLPLPYMGGECLRTPLSPYTEVWSACGQYIALHGDVEGLRELKLQTSKMKRFAWKRVIEIIITILTTIVTTLGTVSCMG